jgi:hypothetical protein
VTARAGRVTALVVGVLAFLVVSGVVARWLSADGAERTKVEDLLAAQARGDASAMAGQLGDCDQPCRERMARLATRLRGSGDVAIVRFESETSHALGEKTGRARVVWKLPSTLPTVQCVTVQRKGTALTGPRVTLLDLSAPIGREAGC